MRTPASCQNDPGDHGSPEQCGRPSPAVSDHSFAPAVSRASRNPTTTCMNDPADGSRYPVCSTDSWWGMPPSTTKPAPAKRRGRARSWMIGDQTPKYSSYGTRERVAADSRRFRHSLTNSSRPAHTRSCGDCVALESRDAALRNDRFNDAEMPNSGAHFAIGRLGSHRTSAFAAPGRPVDPRHSPGTDCKLASE